jgi:hypothetical protein
VEEKPGDRFLAQKELSALLRPTSWLQYDSKWAQGHEAIGLPAKQKIDCYWRCIKALEAQIQTYHFRDICSSQALKDLVDSGEYSRDGVFTEGEADKAEHLRNIISILEKYDNYEIALV